MQVLALPVWMLALAALLTLSMPLMTHNLQLILLFKGNTRMCVCVCECVKRLID